MTIVLLQETFRNGSGSVYVRIAQDKLSALYRVETFNNSRRVYSNMFPNLDRARQAYNRQIRKEKRS